MSERYHKAARDGYLALLKEATRKDLNTPDGDGMTPTLWAAYHGQVEALQLICSRGGEPNVCDIWGNTPLHHAATNGHLHVVTFLINFGANIWALDNDFHSAMDAAAAKDRMECVRLLDTAATKQNITHPKQVARLKEKARKDAEKQIKECERLKKKHENRRNKKYTREMEASSSGSGPMHGETVSSLSHHFSKVSTSQRSGTAPSFMKGSLQKKLKKKEGKATAERQLGKDVIFVSHEGSNGLRTNVIDVFGEEENRASERSDEAREFEDGDHFGHESLFKRAGLGNMLFRRNFTLGMGIEEEMSTENEIEDAGSRLRNELLKSDWGLKMAENLEDVDEDLEEELPWNEEDIGLDDDEPGTTPLEAFLASQNMMEFIPFLAREQIDLDSLMLCSDDDLRGIRLPLGPRKKLLSAVEKRKMIIKNPQKLIDTVL
ncbi:ankyrin repeat and SAM domain-containing protein 4B [Callorhinchus milii]|uniref:Ankyrin repeat and SAM domain-containing protein 4B n=1 Tax=Callorhinchus milii TaxID=7868 RepID=V9KKR0_CALMI|nr:ankyrin repeat and SAM domain-containing protein 4B [Callorhinchus milii]|eukprot:gi/632952392/ref/XP_007891826.1/ PREDICTED: ankyrin repeat and SAM domain-containing protein 4B [Callorhinchus milii]